MSSVDELRQKVAKQIEHTDAQKARNDKLATEVEDLKNGSSAIEERARLELGMIRQNEIFVQVIPAGASTHDMTPAPTQQARTVTTTNSLRR